MSGTKPRLHKRVPLNQSALYAIRSKRRLSKILLEKESLLDWLSSKNENYNVFEDNGRTIQNPKPHLKRIHSRFAFLLGQIDTPDYLHSAVKKRSYITNAEGHSVSKSSVKTDIRKFYPSARSAEVFRFLIEDLRWERDVAACATKILCYNNHLPTGGNASPILSFWAYKPLFDAISEVSLGIDCKFSLYVDDITLTGELANPSLLFEVRKLIGAHRLKAHKSKYFPAGTAKVITGAAQTINGLKLPYSREMKIWEVRAELALSASDKESLELYKPLIGRLYEAAQIDRDRWKREAESAVIEFKEVEQRHLSRPFVTPSATPLVESEGDDGSDPW